MPIPDYDGPVPRALLRDTVYERLCEAIVDGSFRPGERLRDGDLATWLGVSRTPVREALLRLGRTGLVIATPSRSTVVAAIDAQTFHDAVQVVGAMHELALRLAMTRLLPEHLAAMRAANARFADALAREDVEEALDADDELHAVALDAAGNAALRDVVEQFTPVLRRVERQRFSSLSGRRSVTLHKRLIKACAASNADAAAAVSNDIWSTLGLLIDLDETTTPRSRS